MFTLQITDELDKMEYDIQAPNEKQQLSSL